MKEMKRYLKNERGDGLMLVIIGMLFVSIFICYLFFDFSNVFISKRVSQTGADAAALAGARSSSDYMSEVLKEKVEDELESLVEAWEDVLEAFLDDEDDTRTLEEVFDEFISSIESSKDGRKMPSKMRDYIWNGSGEVEGTPALLFLFKDPVISDMACKAVRDHLVTSRQEAVSFTEKNQNDRLVDYQFLEDEFKIYAKTERDGKYITIPDSSVSGISASAAVQIGSPKGVQISCS